MVVKTDETAHRKYNTTINDLRGKISKYRDQSLDVRPTTSTKLSSTKFSSQKKKSPLTKTRFSS